MAGISILQGPHHVAQKFRNTGWPRWSCSAIRPVVRAGTSKSGAKVSLGGRRRSRAARGSAAAAGATQAVTRDPTNASTVSGRTFIGEGDSSDLDERDHAAVHVHRLVAV